MNMENNEKEYVSPSIKPLEVNVSYSFMSEVGGAGGPDEGEENLGY